VRHTPPRCSGRARRRPTGDHPGFLTARSSCRRARSSCRRAHRRKSGATPRAGPNARAQRAAVRAIRRAWQTLQPPPGRGLPRRGGYLRGRFLQPQHPATLRALQQRCVPRSALPLRSVVREALASLTCMHHDASAGQLEGSS
jgi:hypothetical protein